MFRSGYSRRRPTLAQLILNILAALEALRGYMGFGWTLRIYIRSL